jgi:hypothetical protein
VYENGATLLVSHELPEPIEGFVVYVLVTYREAHVLHTRLPDHLRLVEPAILSGLAQVDHSPVAGGCQALEMLSLWLSCGGYAFQGLVRVFKPGCYLGDSFSHLCSSSCFGYVIDGRGDLLRLKGSPSRSRRG